MWAVLLVLAACASTAEVASLPRGETHVDGVPGGQRPVAKGGRGGTKRDRPPAPPPRLQAENPRLVPYLRHDVDYVVGVIGPDSGGYEVLHYEGSFWTLYESHWFFAARVGDPWKHVEMKAVPRELFRVCGYRPARLQD